jgi:hypothetical protein
MSNNQKSIESLAEQPASANNYREVNLTSVDFEPSTPFKGIYVGGTGDITVRGMDGVEVTLVGVAAGVAHPIAGAAIIRATTDATDLVALY